MQLKEILSQLETTPTLFSLAVAAVFIIAIVSFLVMLSAANDSDDNKFMLSTISLAVFALTGIGIQVYTESAKDSAAEEVKIMRVNDKIHIESNSEFMKSADLDVVAEKDGYIYVEFENKTYRIEDLSKKGN